MEMKNPSHPGRIIAGDMEELGLSVAKTAKALGITRQALYNVINGKAGISADMAMRLELAFGGSADHLLRMQSYYDLAQIRKRKPKLKIKRFELQLS
jgi:addiction module HigA family antidote